LDNYAFPADLVEDVYARWHATAHVTGLFRRPTLPPRAQLRRIFQVAYLAGLETDEGRSLRFTLCCTPPLHGVQRYGRDELVEAWELDTPRPFDVQELRRLAATVDMDGAALWVEFRESGDEPACIRGLLNLGRSWAHAREGFAFHYDALPDTLTVRVEGPGRLAVYHGQQEVASLAGGRLGGGQLVHDSLHGIYSLLEEGRAHFSRLVAGPRLAPGRAAQDFEWTAYMSVLMAIVNSIRNSGHGGALVLTGRSSRAAEPGVELLKAKYRPRRPVTHLADRFVRLLDQRHALIDVQWRLESEAHDAMAAPEPVVPGLEALRLAYAEVRDANEALAEVCAFVGNLAGTDGALMLRYDLALLGFGGEIRLEKAPPAPVFEVYGASLEDVRPLDSEQFGMRHRSAMRLCAADPALAVFVVSQDGGVSLVFNHRGRVFLRRDIATTVAGSARG
jgi:hypothetical protein